LRARLDFGSAFFFLIVFAWVKEMAELCQPERIHWCDGSDAENQALCDLMVKSGTFIKLNAKKRPGSLSGPLASQRRGARGRPDVHLLQDQGRSRADEQLGRPGRDEAKAARPVQGLHEGPHDVCHSVCDGAARFAHLQNRH
jgi:hypothetical protein